jgi:hypothetical protein
LHNLEIYDFKIRAWDKVLLPSDFSENVKTVHYDHKAPNKPTGLEVIQISENALNLTWNVSTDNDVVEYLVFVNQTGSGIDGPYELTKRVITNNLILTGLAANTRYYFVLQAFDEAGNPSEISEAAWNSTKAYEPPKIIDAYPEDNSEGFEVTRSVTIVFSISMDANSLSSVVDISPATYFVLNFTDDNKIMQIRFQNKLKYNTTYKIIIGRAKSVIGGILEDAPFTLTFKTILKPTVTIITPRPNMNVKPGEFIIISGESNGYVEGTDIKISLDKENEVAKIKHNGTWSLKIRAPPESGDYILTIIVDDQTFLSNIKVLDSPDEIEVKEKDDEDRNYLEEE